MLNAVTRTLIFSLLLMLSTAQIVRAERKLYQYDGKLPFVEMMLGMMATMGIIDRVPNSMVNRGYGGYGSRFPYSDMSSPYARALASRGISPTAFSSLGNPYTRNPFMRSPWLQSPLSQNEFSQDGLNPLSPVWGSPDWGVLPIESYSLNNLEWDKYDPYDGMRGAYSSDPYWSRDDINGWVNEPWENSSWNPDTELALRSKQTKQEPQPALVQNFNYNVPTKPANADSAPTQRSRQASKQANKQGSRSYNASPLAKLASPGRPVRSSKPVRKPSPLAKQNRRNGAPQSRPPQNRAPQNRPIQDRQNKPGNRVYQKPCVTEFCGLKKPDLDGLWVAQNGEILGINNKRYLWSDSQSRYLTGQLKIQNEYLLANVDGHNKLMTFKYKLAGNHLLTMKADGTVREFTRVSRSQYQRYIQDGSNLSSGQNYRGYN